MWVRFLPYLFMSDKKPSFQEFFGLSDDEKEAFEEACEIAVSSDKELEEKTQKTDVAKRLNCSDELVKIMAKEIGLSEDDNNKNNDN